MHKPGRELLGRLQRQRIFARHGGRPHARAQRTRIDQHDANQRIRNGFCCVGSGERFQRSL